MPQFKRRINADGTLGHYSKDQTALLWQKRWQRLPSWLSPIAFVALGIAALFALAYAVRAFGDYTTERALRERREKRAEKRKKRREDRELQEKQFKKEMDKVIDGGWKETDSDTDAVSPSSGVPSSRLSL